MNWNEIQGLSSVDSPGLLIDPDVVQSNIAQMISIVGGPDHIDRLRPHAKTHKMPAVSKMQVEAGIGKFKAATIAESSMLAASGASDVLLAHQPVGPKIDKLVSLVKHYPNVTFGCIVDNPGTVQEIVSRRQDSYRSLRMFIDVDCGMHRTGIAIGDAMFQLRDAIENIEGACYAGLHVYDGHIHDESLDVRRQRAEAIIQQIRESGLDADGCTVIGGGSPTFSIWAEQTPWECSPGTTLLWDIGYGGAFPDLGFDIGAALLTRVISKPGEGLICLDLGHKAVAAEMPLADRVQFPALTDATLVGQSEEHLVVRTSRAADIAIGETVIGIPRHICPTVALHSYASIVRGGAATDERWEITARNR